MEIVSNMIERLPRFRRAARNVDALREHELWSRNEIERFQLTRINRLWGDARLWVPYYRDLVLAERLPNEFHSLDEFRALVPVLGKQLVRSNPERFLSQKREVGKWSRTGGSTGLPMKVYWGITGHREMLTCKYRGEQAWGLNIFDRKVLLWGHSNSCSPGWRGCFEKMVEPCIDRMRHRRRLSAYRLGDADLSRHLKEMQRFRPSSIYGYSTAVMLLAQHAEKLGVKLPSLRLAIMTGEPADSEMISQCERGFQCPAAVEYGSMECGLLAYRYPDGTLRVREDVVHVETTPRTDGRYDIIVTVLNNPSFPLIRYAIEDVSSGALEQWPSGFAILPDVAGRNNDVLVTRSGHIIHSMAIKHAIENNPMLRRYQVIQDTTGALNVILETNAENAESFEPMRQKLEFILEGFPVHLRLAHEILGSPSGKHRWIFSELCPLAMKKANGQIESV